MEAKEEVLDINMPDAEESGGDSIFFEKRNLPDGVEKVFQSFLPKAQEENRSYWFNEIVVRLQRNGISFDDAEKYAPHFDQYYEKRNLPDGVEKVFQSFLPKAQEENVISMITLTLQENGISFDNAKKYAAQFREYYDQQSGRKKQ